MIRDVTGLNEARDGSLPDRDTLVGLQKIAAQQSNIATKHINNASLYLTLSPCRNCSKLIYQAGIKRVIYYNRYKDEAGIEFLKQAGVEIEHLKYINDENEKK